MKKYNSIKVVLITIVLFLLLTWILPAASFSSEFQDQGRIQMGLFDLFSYPLTSLSYFGYIAWYILMVGGFYGILYKIPAYRNLLDKIADKFRAKGTLFVGIMMVLIAVITSVCGAQLAFILFFPFIASIILLMGFDKIVVALTLVGSTMVGIIGTTLGYNNVSVLISESLLNQDLGDNIGAKVLVLVFSLILLVVNTVMYIKKTGVVTDEDSKSSKKAKAESKKEKVVEIEVEEDDDDEDEDDEEEEKEEKKDNNKSSKSTNNKKTNNNNNKKNNKSSKNNKKKSSKSKNNNKAAATDDDVIVVKNMNKNEHLVPNEVEGKHSTLPLVITFLFLLVILVLAFIPWSNAFKITGMEDATTAVTEYTLFDFPIFAKLLGNFNTFGSWMVNDMIVVLFVVVLVLSLIYKLKFDAVMDGFVAGAKKAVTPAVLTILLYLILVMNTYHPYQLTIYKAVIDITGNFNVFTSTIVAILSSIFNVDPLYAYQAAVPYLLSVVSNKDVYNVIELLFQSIYGFTMLFAPTSLILMGTLSYLNVSYKDWLKNVWKFLLELLVVLLILFTMLILVG